MVVQKRSGFRIVLLEPTMSWLKENKCGGCGKVRKEWVDKSLRYNTCSTKCTEVMNVNYRIFWWAEMRERIFERDKYICKACNNENIKEVIGEQTSFLEERTKEWKQGHNGLYIGYKEDYIKSRINQWLKSQLDADHITPIALGGEEWDMNNIQTLCKQCHKNKTRKDIKKISSERKITIDQTRLT